MKNTQELTALSAPTIRSLVMGINKRKIQKEDIVNILKDSDTYFVLYYKNDEGE